MAGTLTVDTVKSGLSTPTVFQNTSGVEVGQLTKYWASLTPSTPATKASFNQSSITKNGTGDCSMTFSVAFSDANYAINGLSNHYSGVNVYIPYNYQQFPPTTTYFRITWLGTTWNLVDPSYGFFSANR